MLSSAPRHHPHLYEIPAWVWLNELSRRHGREIHLGNVPEQEWDAILEKGFDFVWLMGVWKRSPASRAIAQTDAQLRQAYDRALPGWSEADVVGSPYAVQAYEPDPRVGTWDDLAQVQTRLHTRGIRVMLDFVVNHTATDHAWVTQHPEYYVQYPPERAEAHAHACFSVPSVSGHTWIAHGKDPYFPPWTDTAQLNFVRPETREALIQELVKIAGVCDGVRCDMAMLVMNRIFPQTWQGLIDAAAMPSQEFWTAVRQALPQLVLMAEVYWDLEWELQQLGFDFTYDKRLYDRLRHGDHHGVKEHLAADPAFQRKLVRFLENHDEPRSQDVFGQRLKAMAVLVGTLPGMRFYHYGQLEGRRRSLPVQLARLPEEAVEPETAAIYDSILHLANAAIFHDGVWRPLPVNWAGNPSHANLVATVWRLDKEAKIVAVNLDHGEAQGYVWLREMGQQGFESASYRIEEEYGGDRKAYTVSRSDLMGRGLFVTLPGYAALVLSVTPI